VAREFADNADKTHGKSMIIVGAAMNHWYHMDMNYRGLINMLMLCGCVGQSGGGWAHYVGQEKLRPQCGWLPLAFGLDWMRPPRQMNGTSFFYNHSSQWRHEKMSMFTRFFLRSRISQSSQSTCSTTIFVQNVQAGCQVRRSLIETHCRSAVRRLPRE
jgi:nitrate reductase alpha subunit